MRPVASTSYRSQAAPFLGIHQSVLGQIGFRVDTRVYGVRAVSLPTSTALGALTHRIGPDGWAELSEAAGLVHLDLDLRGSLQVLFGGTQRDLAHRLTFGSDTVRLERLIGSSSGLIGEVPCRATSNAR